MRARASLCLSMMALCLLAAGCGSQNNLWGQYLQVVRQSFGGASNRAVSREQAAAVPYASLGYRVDGGPESMLVLATDNSAGQLWTASSHVVLLISGGRILRSIGLPHDIAGTTPQNSDTLPSLSDAVKGPLRSVRVVDLPDIGAYSVQLVCVATRRGSQTIEILGAKLPTTRIDETCSSANPRWSFTDNYWLDSKTGFVWHSVQHLHPAGTIVQIEILRPPG